MRFFKHLSYRTLFTKAVMGISVICLFASDGLTVSATTIKEENIAYNQSLAVQSNAVANWPTGPVISAESAILMDADTGAILYAKNIHQKEYPASTTKILTTLIASERCSMDEIVDFSYDAVHDIDPGSNHIAIEPGEQLTMEECLNAILIRSANEVSFAVAEHISGTTWQDFGDIMNERAKELGCVDSHFVNPNGLHDPDHYTTAYDMALITKEALTSKTFREYASETYHEIPPTNMNNETRYLTQGNRMMLSNSEYYYPACQGGKTGYTDDAGGTLVVWAEKNDMQLICVTMGAPDNATNYTDSIALFNYVFNNYSNTTLLSDYEFDAEAATTAQNFLNDYYGCENLGTMHLSVDNNQPFIFANNADRTKLQMNFVPSADRLDEGYIGTLEVSYEGTTCLTLPVSYSGYVNSNDDVAVAEAYKNGSIRPALIKEKKSYWKYIIAAVVVACILGLFIYANVIEPRKRKQNSRSRRR